MEQSITLISQVPGDPNWHLLSIKFVFAFYDRRINISLKYQHESHDDRILADNGTIAKNIYIFKVTTIVDWVGFKCSGTLDGKISLLVGRAENLYLDVMYRNLGVG